MSDRCQQLVFEGLLKACFNNKVRGCDYRFSAIIAYLKDLVTNELVQLLEETLVKVHCEREERLFSVASYISKATSSRKLDHVRLTIF